MKINVLESDILEGKQDNACYCPVAQAINRTLRLPLDEQRFAVSPRTFRVYDKRSTAAIYGEEEALHRMVKKVMILTYKK